MLICYGISSLQKCLYESFAHLLIRLLSYRSSLYILDVSPFSDRGSQIFSPFLWVAFLFCCCFLMHKSFFVEVQLTYFSFVASALSLCLSDSLPYLYIAKAIFKRFKTKHFVTLCPISYCIIKGSKFLI